MEFLPGDIVAVEARTSLKLLNWLVSPYTDRGHYFILGNKIKDTEDRVIYESLITSGVRIGKLSWYEGKDIEVYRVSKEVGAEVVRNIADYSGLNYDHFYFVRLVLNAIKYRVKHGKAIPYDKLTCKPNNSYLCTELIAEAYKPHIQFVPDNVAATPAALVNAYSQGKMELIYEGELNIKVGEASKKKALIATGAIVLGIVTLLTLIRREHA